MKNMWQRITLIKRSIKFYLQRKKRGWDDGDTWSLDLTIAEFILPRLKRFREVTCGYPGDLSEEKWDKILSQMIEAFEIVVIEQGPPIEPSTSEKSKKVRRGLDLFRDYYFGLWW